MTPTVHGEFLDAEESHLLLKVGDVEREPYVNLRADRGDRIVEVDYSADVFDNVSVDTWGIVKDLVEGHLEAQLPHPEVSASWGKADDQVRKAFLPWVEEFSDQLGICDG